jgi:hypothetical protein
MDVSNAEVPVQLYNGTALSYAYATNEIGRELKVTIQAVDRDGLGSDIAELSVDIPSYLREVDFYPDAGSASGSPAYSMRLSWDSYPFIPAGTGFWHLAVFYYNEDAKKLPFLGQLNTGHNWGAGVSMPSAFKTSYANCLGSATTGASLILADEAAKCSHFFGGARSHAIDFGLLRDKTITLPVLAQTFGGTNPTSGESYITVAFYAYTPGGALGSDMRLVAVDKTRYYLSE